MLLCCWNVILPKFSKLGRLPAPAAVYISYDRTTRTCPCCGPTDISWALLLMIHSKITFFSRIPYSHPLAKISHFPYHSYHSLQSSLFLWSGLTVICCQANFRSSAYGRDSASNPSSQHAISPRQGACAVNWIRKSVLILSALFQSNRSPALVHSMGWQWGGVETTEEWCSIAWG